MARRTDGEKIDELEKFVAVLNLRADETREDLNLALSKIDELTKIVAEIRITIAVMQRDIQESQRDRLETKREREEGSKKRWSLLPPAISAVLSGIISALVAYFVAKR